MAAYPVQVFTLGRISGIFGVLIFAALFVMVLRVIRSRQSLIMPRHAFIILALLFPLPFAYLIATLHNGSEYYSETFNKTLALYLITFAISIDRNLIFFAADSAFLKRRKGIYHSITSFTAFAIPLVLMSLAVIKNSMGAIPPGVILNDKYFYGVFVRAGAGFVDPNALGVIVIVVLVIFLEQFMRFRALTILALGTALITVLLTFSRTAQILFVGFLLFKFRKKVSRSGAFLFATTVAAIIIYYAKTHPELVGVFFERFFNAEGASSTDDRRQQLAHFFDILSSASFLDSIFGFGGQDFFQEISGSAMHSAIFSIVLDVGIIPGISVLLFFGYAVHRSFRARAAGFRVLALLSTFVLPYMPEMFFLLAIYVIVEEQKTNILWQIKVNGSHVF
jgi:hypothetical protein